MRNENVFSAERLFRAQMRTCLRFRQKKTNFFWTNSGHLGGHRYIHTCKFRYSMVRLHVYIFKLKFKTKTLRKLVIFIGKYNPHLYILYIQIFIFINNYIYLVIYFIYKNI